MPRLIPVLTAAVICAALTTTSKAADINAGRDLARQHCTRCHIVGDLNTMGIGSTPSFQYMVKHIKDFDHRFLTFYSLRPHPAFVRIKGLPTLNDLPSPIAPIHLTLEGVEDIAAFAATLQDK